MDVLDILLFLLYVDFLECNFPLNPLVRLSVDWSVDCTHVLFCYDLWEAGRVYWKILHSVCQIVPTFTASMQIKSKQQQRRISARNQLLALALKLYRLAHNIFSGLGSRTVGIYRSMHIFIRVACGNLEIPEHKTLSIINLWKLYSQQALTRL